MHVSRPACRRSAHQVRSRRDSRWLLQAAWRRPRGIIHGWSLQPVNRIVLVPPPSTQPETAHIDGRRLIGKHHQLIPTDEPNREAGSMSPADQIGSMSMPEPLKTKELRPTEIGKRDVRSAPRARLLVSCCHNRDACTRAHARRAHRGATRWMAINRSWR